MKQQTMVVTMAMKSTTAEAMPAMVLGLWDPQVWKKGLEGTGAHTPSQHPLILPTAPCPAPSDNVQYHCPAPSDTAQCPEPIPSDTAQHYQHPVPVNTAQHPVALPTP